jgi:hypothetical protein
MSAFLKHNTNRSLEQRRSPTPSLIPSEGSVPGNPTLCVDLDGTLIKSDLLWEGVVALLKSNPVLLLRIPFWLLKGKANVKRELANHTGIKAPQLPYRKEIVEFLRQEQASGRSIVLTTASDRELANAVAEYSQDVGLLYRNPQPLLLISPISLYWMSHICLRPHRGESNEDPVTFAIRDRLSYAVGAAAALAIAASILGIGL